MVISSSPQSARLCYRGPGAYRLPGPHLPLENTRASVSRKGVRRGLYWRQANQPKATDMTFWTDERIDELRALAGTGTLSAAKIAARLGCTRNAVLGKLLRLGVKLPRKYEHGARALGPYKKAGEHLDRQINLYTTSEMAQLVDEHARRQGMGMSAWIRRAIVAALAAESAALPHPQADSPSARILHREKLPLHAA
jgi:hypothetical protein